MLRRLGLCVALVFTPGCGDSTDPDDNAPATATVDTPVCMHPVMTVPALVMPPGGVPPAADTPLVLRGLVATSPKFLVRSVPGNGCVYGFWAADAAMAMVSHGILVTGRGNDATDGGMSCAVTGGGGRIPDDLAVGDTVDVSGEYIGYHSPTALCSDTIPQIEDLCAVTRRSRGAAVSPVTGLDAGDLGDDASMPPTVYDHVLVSTQSVTVTAPDTDRNGRFFTVMGAHGALRVSTLLLGRDSGYHTPAMGARFTSITGVLYRDGCHWQLVPRNAADLVAGM